MDQQSLVLAALSPAEGAPFSPVQVQKLLFLIDRNIPTHIGGSVFHFEPYDYGPFDKEVYKVLDLLALTGDVEIINEPGRSWQKYALTENGQKRGEKILEGMSGTAQSYITEASEFVRKLSFSQLVSSIYRAYPEMKENSVFNSK